MVRVLGAHHLRNAAQRIALLMDSAAASSAEATLLAFRNQRNARSFGQQTCGLANSKKPFPLSDGALLDLHGLDGTERKSEARLVQLCQTKYRWTGRLVGGRVASPRALRHSRSESSARAARKRAGGGQPLRR